MHSCVPYRSIESERSEYSAHLNTSPIKTAHGHQQTTASMDKNNNNNNNIIEWAIALAFAAASTSSTSSGAQIVLPSPLCKQIVGHKMRLFIIWFYRVCVVQTCTTVYVSVREKGFFESSPFGTSIAKVKPTWIDGWMVMRETGLILMVVYSSRC